jgi:hypothetical protein
MWGMIVFGSGKKIMLALALQSKIWELPGTHNRVPGVLRGTFTLEGERTSSKIFGQRPVVFGLQSPFGPITDNDMEVVYICD